MDALEHWIKNLAFVGAPGWLRGLSICQWLSPHEVTFEVDGAVSIHIGLLHNLRDLTGRELLPQEPLHGLLQLPEGDLPVSIGVELTGAEG